MSYEVLGSNLWATKMLEGLKSQLVEFVMEKQSFSPSQVECCANFSAARAKKSKECRYFWEVHSGSSQRLGAIKSLLVFVLFFSLLKSKQVE